LPYTVISYLQNSTDALTNGVSGCYAVLGKSKLRLSRAVSRRVAVLLVGTTFSLIGALHARTIVDDHATNHVIFRRHTPAPGSLPRLIVKFKTPLALEIEAGLTLPARQLQQPSPAVQAWLKKNRLQTLRPIYPTELREKIQSGLSGHQVAENMRNKFPRRAQRTRGVFNPPDILRTYILDTTNLTAAELRAVLKQVRADPDVEFAQFDQVVRVEFITNDPYFNSSGSWGQSYRDLYGLTNISCPAAWDTANGAGVVVAVIDSGMDYRHPDLTNQVWINPGEIPGNGIDDDGNGYVDDVRGWDFVGTNYITPQPGNDPVDHFGHGTHVAGTIAAEGNNGIGVVGVAWGAKVMDVKALDDGGFGSDSELASAIIYAADNGADVINASWGGPGSSPVLEDAVNYASSLGVVFVAAAGNSGADVAGFYPAGLAAAIAVGALTPSGTNAYFSNFGYGLDVAAPGVDILSLRATNTYIGIPLNGQYTRLDGTSMAAPHVAGLVALILSLHPGYSPEEVRQVLRKSADRILPANFDVYSNFDEYSGYGRINAANAMALGPVLASRILTPSKEAIVAGTATITGVAAGAGFVNYTLDYGAGDAPATWFILAQSNSPVDHDTLGSIIASGIADGRYTIRLRAFDILGAVFEDHLQINVDNTFISSPPIPANILAATEYKTGLKLAITGTALSSNFRKFHVNWARGFEASNGWSSVGISTTGDGNQPVTNGVLATWNSGVMTQTDYVTIRLQVMTSAFTNEAHTDVYLEPDLYSTNWPQTLDEGWGGSPSSVQLARSSSGSNVLIVITPQQGAALPSRAWRFSLDGAFVTNYPLDQSRYGLAAVANLDGQPGDEIAAAESQDVRIIHEDGTSVVAQTSSSNLQFGQTLPTLADLDGDGMPEVLACANNATNMGSWVYAWKGDGTLFGTNFPISLPDGGVLPGQILPVDVDEDGIPELLVALTGTNYDFSLKMFRGNGQPMAWTTQVFTGGCLRLAAGDLEGDGRPDIIMAQDDQDDADWIYTLVADGSLRPGWPVHVADDSQIRLLVADLNRDGRNEVIAASADFDGGGGEIHVFRADGSPFPGAWPVGAGDLGPPVVADIDGDGTAEILVTGSVPVYDTNGMWLYSDPMLLAYRADGTLARSWHLPGAGGNKPFTGDNIVVGDFDGDGKVDIAVNYGLIPADGDQDSFAVGGVLTVLRLNTPWLPNIHDWPVSFHDAQNSTVGFVPARLRMANFGPDFLVMWPRQLDSVILQSRDDLVLGGWTTVSAPMVASNCWNTVTLQATNSRRFYRLEYAPPAP
jgi:hypothetical protein